MREIRKCKTCGKEFSFRNSPSDKGKGIFCSCKCIKLLDATKKKMSEFRKQYYSKEENRLSISKHKSCHWKGGEIKTKCHICGKEFQAKPSWLKKGRAKYCSRKCFSKWWTINIARKYNIIRGWDGSHTPLRRRLRNSEQYRYWRNHIFMRDGFVCSKCGMGGKILEVHHIIPMASLIRDAICKYPLFDKYWACLIYPPIWDIDNGITLCKFCHRLKNKSKMVKVYDNTR